MAGQRWAKSLPKNHQKSISWRVSFRKTTLQHHIQRHPSAHRLYLTPRLLILCLPRHQHPDAKWCGHTSQVVPVDAVVCLAQGTNWPTTSSTRVRPVAKRDHHLQVSMIRKIWWDGNRKYWWWVSITTLYRSFQLFWAIRPSRQYLLPARSRGSAWLNAESMDHPGIRGCSRSKRGMPRSWYSREHMQLWFKTWKLMWVWTLNHSVVPVWSFWCRGSKRI